jgi:HSP20 family protein
MANIIRSDPLGEVARFDPLRDIEDFFSNRRLRSFFRDLPEAPEIKMDVSEDDKAYQVKAEIPGVKKEDIRVAIDGNSVSITAEVKREKVEKKGETVLRSERYYGSQSRSFTVRHDVDQAKAEAKYQDGILELTLPKKGGAAVKELTVR